MYRVLQEEDQENFEGFDLSQGYVALLLLLGSQCPGDKSMGYS